MSLKIARTPRVIHNRTVIQGDFVVVLRFSFDARSKHDLRPVDWRQRMAPPRFLSADRDRYGGHVGRRTVTGDRKPPVVLVVL